jgi:hypothetical protein
MGTSIFPYNEEDFSMKTFGLHSYDKIFMISDHWLDCFHGAQPSGFPCLYSMVWLHLWPVNSISRIHLVDRPNVALTCRGTPRGGKTRRYRSAPSAHARQGQCHVISIVAGIVASCFSFMEGALAAVVVVGGTIAVAAAIARLVPPFWFAMFITIFVIFESTLRTCVPHRFFCDL